MLFTDHPEAYLAGDRRRALATGVEMPDRVTGCALFADISGFTPLTEALAAELGPQRGAEELTAVLDLVFDAVLGELHEHGGVVIYFSGDAVTCWIDKDDGTRGVACGLAMQRAMARVATIRTPGGTSVQLAMKVAVAAGAARRFVVGDPDIQLIDVLAGALMDRLADAEHYAEKGEVLVDDATLRALGDRLVLVTTRGEDEDRVGVVADLDGPRPEPPPKLPYPRLSDAVVRQWLLPPVYERMSAGRGEFLADLRPAVPMFVRFGGIDFDSEEDAQVRLDDFVRKAQRAIDGYGGNVLQLTIGDKGAYLYAVFGSPLAHEDDADRACAAALDVLALEGSTAAQDLQIGLATGRLRSGTYGHQQRRTFCCLGDAVNLSARLMSSAPAGQVYVAGDLAAATGGSFTFDELPDLKVKGKSRPVTVRRLTGRSSRAPSRRRRVMHDLVGRAAELTQLLRLADVAATGHGQVVALTAEAGMGKTRLAEELVRRIREGGVPTYTGEAASVGSATSYLAWHGVWTELLDVAGDGDPTPGLERALLATDASLVPRLPLMGPVLGVTFEDNSLTRTFDAKLRKSSLESLLLRYLTVRAGAGPLVIVLEDCHWMDPLSRDLLDVVARGVAALPVLVLLTYRPGSFVPPGVPHTTVVDIDRLDDDSCRQLLTARLEELYGGTPSESLLRRLTARAEGNPLYLEELLGFLHAGGVDPADDAAVAALDLPASLASLVLSRIDALQEAQRRTLKVASVVGRDFDLDALTGSYPELGPRSEVAGQLEQLCADELIVHDDGPSDTYAFKHAVIREVAYESLPFAQRGALHGHVGSWLEIVDPQALDLLAHHFWHSTDEGKKRTHLLRAGEAAQARYANEAAVDYFRRVAPLLPPVERGPVLLRLGAVLELVGEWPEAEQVYATALVLATDPDAAGLARAATAEAMRKQGRYDEAAVQLDLANRLFAEAGDPAGRGRVAHLRGTLAAQTGDYPRAKREYVLSIALREQLDDRAAMAALASNLAIVAEYEGDLATAQDLNKQALDLRQQVGDPWAIGVSQNNLGMVALLRNDYAEARDRFEETLRLGSEVGDAWMAAIAHNNLGNAGVELGDIERARQHYAEAVAAQEVLGDRWAQAILLDDIAVMAARSGDGPSAFRLLGAAESLHASVGAPRSPTVVAELEQKVANCRAELGDTRVEELLAEGRQLNDVERNRLATLVCTDPQHISGSLPRPR